MREFISKLLLSFGLICYIFAIYFIVERTNPHRISFASTDKVVLSKHTSSKIMPNRLTISSVNIDLPILPAGIHNGAWETTTDGVSYLTASPLPGEVGNSILYGHNWQSLI